jgi:hypothetical protein
VIACSSRRGNTDFKRLSELIYERNIGRKRRERSRHQARAEARIEREREKAERAGAKVYRAAARRTQ